MAKRFKFITAVLTVLFPILLFCYIAFETRLLLTLAITSGTFAYHFIMRLIVGLIIDKIFHNNISYDKKWFKEHRFEKKLYSVLKVKKWKEHIPTYQPETFSADKGLSFIAKATCQAELVHEIIVALSFMPVLLTIFFGDFWVFFLTSFFSALFDMIFVIVQRFNRPRLIKIIEKRLKK